MWVVTGDIDSYRDQRKNETGKDPTFLDGAAFHNGKNVLESVKVMHERLLGGEEPGQIRPCDYVTRSVLEQMVASMLEVCPEHRPKAQVLYQNSKRILEKAQRRLLTPNGPSTNAWNTHMEGAQSALVIPHFGSSPESFEFGSKHPNQNRRSATFSVADNEPEELASGRQGGSKGRALMAGPFPPNTPADTCLPNLSFVHEPVAYKHGTGRQVELPRHEADDPNGPETPFKHHRRRIDGSNQSGMSAASIWTPDSSAASMHTQGWHIETDTASPWAGQSETSPNRSPGLHHSTAATKARPPTLPFKVAQRHISEHKEASGIFKFFSRKSIQPLHQNGYLNEVDKREHVRKSQSLALKLTSLSGIPD